VYKKILISVLMQAAFAGVLSAQSVPAALSPSTYYVGVQPIAVNPDWGCAKGGPISCWDHEMYGFESYVGINQIYKRMGVEGTIRMLNWGGVSSDMRESNYVIGPTFRLIGYRTFSLSANMQVGLASITLPKAYGERQPVTSCSRPVVSWMNGSQETSVSATNTSPSSGLSSRAI